MGKDTLKTLGATNHSLEERSKLDYYGTDPRATQALLEVETFDKNIWEPAAGHHLISNELEKAGYNVKSTDIADYGFGDELGNFLDFKGTWNGTIFTNPPYELANEFAIKALEIIPEGHKVVMFLRTLFLEGQKRYDTLFSKNPPKTVYVFSTRVVADKNDDFNHGSAVSYSFFVWEKGYKGDPVIKWLKIKK